MDRAVHQVMNNKRPDNNTSNDHASITNPLNAQPMHHPESVQTSESFRISSSFNAYAEQTTPPCARSQLTPELKLRFDMYDGSVESLMATIYGRRQQKNESLPDFVDDMQFLMMRLPEHFTEAVRISTIISCALPEYSRLLLCRDYSDITDFTNHVALLCQNRSKSTIDEPDKRMISDKPVYSCDIDNDESGSDSNDEDEGLDIQAITTAIQKSLAGLKIKRPNKPGSEQKKSKYQSELDTRAKDRHTTAPDMNERKSKIQCFGCGAPDVYFSSCEKCQNNLTGNNRKREIYCFGCGTQNVYYTYCDSCQAQK